MIPVNHTVPGVGYCVSSRRACIAFSGDTTTNDSLWKFSIATRRSTCLFVELGVLE